MAVQNDQGALGDHALPAPGVVQAGVVVAAAEAPGGELAVGPAVDVGEQVHAVGEGVEDVLAADRQRHVPHERNAGLEVEDEAAVEKRRRGAAHGAGVDVVDPRSVLVQAAEQAAPSQPLIDGDVPARLGHTPFEGEHVAGAEQVGLLRYLSVGVVQRGAENGIAA